MAKIFLIAGSCSACLAVVLGAFAAHILKDKLSSEMFSIFEVGVRYHLYHALALFVVAWTCSQFPQASTSISGWLFMIGTAIFSGSLYMLSITELRWLGVITPIGGLSFICGWAWLGWTTYRHL